MDAGQARAGQGRLTELVTHVSYINSIRYQVCVYLMVESKTHSLQIY